MQPLDEQGKSKKWNAQDYIIQLLSIKYYLFIIII